MFKVCDHYIIWLYEVYVPFARKVWFLSIRIWWTLVFYTNLIKISKAIWSTWADQRIWFLSDFNQIDFAHTGSITEHNVIWNVQILICLFRFVIYCKVWFRWSRLRIICFMLANIAYTCCCAIFILTQCIYNTC